MLSSPWILWAIVISYVLFVFLKGVLKARNIGSSDDFLVAGRDIGWFFLFCTMGATVIGGGASIGAIAKTYDWGILMLLVSLGWYVHFIFAGWFVAPRFREANLYTVAGYFGHRFGEGPRFFVLVLSLLFSGFIVAAQMAAFGNVAAAIMPGIADAESILRWAIILGGLMVVIYSTAGGLLAVIHTDVYQFIVLIIGFVITLGFCVPDILASYNTETGRFVPIRFGAVDVADPDIFAARWRTGGGPMEVLLRETVPPPPLTAPQTGRAERERQRQLAQTIANALNTLIEHDDLYQPERFSGVDLSEQSIALLAENASGNTLRRRNLSLLQDVFSKSLTPDRNIPSRFFHPHGGKGWVFLITTFLAFLLGEAFAPGYATRYCVGKNIRATRIGIVGVGIFLALVFPMILFFIALFARIHYPGIDPQQALPMVVQQLNNSVVSGLMIGALLMAVMSSADSALNSATAIFVKDLFEHQLGWNGHGDRRLLQLARLCSAGLGMFSILIAVLWPDIIGLLLFTYHVWAPAIIVPVCVGALCKHRSLRMNRIILATMFTGTGGTLLYRLPITLRDTFNAAFVPDRVYALCSQFDPAVFGVTLSLLFFGAAWLFARGPREPQSTSA